MKLGIAVGRLETLTQGGEIKLGGVTGFLFHG